MLAWQGAPTLTDWLSVEEVQRSHASMLIAAQRVDREPPALCVVLLAETASLSGGVRLDRTGLTINAPQESAIRTT